MMKITIAGVAGRMGHALLRCVNGTPGVQLVGATERAGHEKLGEDCGELVGDDVTGITLTADVGAALRHADVLIDFTFHTAVAGNAALAARLGKAMVIGTTGLDEAETAEVRSAAQRIPIVWAPNMSLGMNVLFAAVEKAASVFGLAYRVELDETHHVHKKDAPSGTALRLAEKVASGRGQDLSTVMLQDPPTNDVPADGIVIRSHRKGEVVGDHTVAFGNETERIEFTHHAWSRDSFAVGALHAARWVAGKAPGLYDMQDVLSL